MKVFITLALFFSSLLSYSQEFQSGYFIDNNGNRVSCFLNREVLYNSPDELEFRSDINGSTQRKTVNEIKEFGIPGAILYRRYTVQIDLSSDRFNDLTTQKNMELVPNTLFIEVLEQGKINLFKYKKGNLLRFFYATSEGQLELLDYKKYLSDSSTNVVSTNEFYKQELLNLMFDAGFTKSQIDQTRYEEKDLQKLVKQYNTYFNKVVETDNKQKDKATTFKLSIKPKVSFTSMDVDYRFNRVDLLFTVRDASFGPKMIVDYGIDFELALSPTISFFFSPSLSTFNDTSVRVVQSGFTTINRQDKINFETVNLSVGFRKYFTLLKKMKVDGYVGAGFTYHRLLNESDAIIVLGNAVTPLYSTNSLNFSLGTRISKTFFVEFTYNTNRNLTNEIEFTETEVKSYSISLMVDVLRFFDKKK